MNAYRELKVNRIRSSLEESHSLKNKQQQMVIKSGRQCALFSTESCSSIWKSTPSGVSQFVPNFGCLGSIRLSSGKHHKRPSCKIEEVRCVL